MTSSFCWTPIEYNAICSAEVPLTIEIAFLLPIKILNLFSNLSTNSPAVDTKLDLIH